MKKSGFILITAMLISSVLVIPLTSQPAGATDNMTWSETYEADFKIKNLNLWIIEADFTPIKEHYEAVAFNIISDTAPPSDTGLLRIMDGHKPIFDREVVNLTDKIGSWSILYFTDGITFEAGHNYSINVFVGQATRADIPESNPPLPESIYFKFGETPASALSVSGGGGGSPTLSLDSSDETPAPETETETNILFWLGVVMLLSAFTHIQIPYFRPFARFVIGAFMILISWGG